MFLIDTMIFDVAIQGLVRDLAPFAALLINKAPIRIMAQKWPSINRKPNPSLSP